MQGQRHMGGSGQIVVSRGKGKRLTCLCLFDDMQAQGR